MGERLGYRAGDLPVSERVHNCLVRLPFYNQMSEEEHQYVIDVVKSFFTKKRKHAVLVEKERIKF